MGYARIQIIARNGMQIVCRVVSLAASQELTDTGMPAVPNIARSLGLVPGAVALFFGTFRPHYALQDIPLAISQAQAEFIAARVSALNQCFY